MRYLPITKPRLMLIGIMVLINWLYCPYIKVMYGCLYRRHLFEFGEPV